MPVALNRRPIVNRKPKIDRATDPDCLAVGLRASSEMAKRIVHPGTDIRPCVATLSETPLSKGDFPDRHTSALIIASELKRIGKDYDHTTRHLTHWNTHNIPPLRSSELRKCIDSAFARDYNYGCYNPVMESLCMGSSDCPFIQTVKSKKGKFNDLIFFDYHWPKYLQRLQTIIYSAVLPYLEKTRRVGRGGLIFASHQQIADTGGMSVRRIGENLRALQMAGLIEYKPGHPRKWEGIASEIRRVFPVPHPTRSIIEKLKDKQWKEPTRQA